VRWASPVAEVTTFPSIPSEKDESLWPPANKSELVRVGVQRKSRKRHLNPALTRRRASRKTVVSRPFASRRSGGTSRGMREHLSQPLGRKGMQPEQPSHRAFAGSAWAAFDADRSVMQHAAMAASDAQPAPREPDPQSVAEALSRPDAAEWQRAMDEEISSCLEHEVWEEADLPPGGQALPSRLHLEIKRDGRKKARLVAGGHRQRQGEDFGPTYAHVCSTRSVRMVLAVAAHEDLELRQFDIKTAFLNAELEEEVYIRPPAGAERLAAPGRVLRLRRALYGLRQAARAWNKRLEGELISKGFQQSAADPSLWILHGESGAVLSMFYVDDGLVAARTAAEADALVELVASMFSIRALGEPQDFLGIDITRDRQARTITIDQGRKATALAAAVGVTGQSCRVPMSPDTYAQLRAAQPGEPLADALEYMSIMGSLQHLAQSTRPDIALAVGALASYSSKPTAAHMKALVEVVRYVGGTASRGITYGHTKTPVEIWGDANFAACLDTRRSTTGWVVVMYGGAVSWSSKKQPTAAASTMDAEYQACGAVAREGLSLIKALDELALLCSDFPITGPLQIFCDNKAAISLCADRKEGQRVKHIDIIHHFARDHVNSGELQFLYCKSEDNVSDCLTKALAKPAFDVCLVGLGMVLV
jgi:Reverse transcriptase (RNA-dependent DNA polymerase)